MWRKQLDDWCKYNNIKTFNPYLNFVVEKNHTYSDKLIVDQNEYYLNKADIMVCNLDDILESPGTQYELVRFKDMKKPVIAFGSPTWSPHINSCISQHCETLDDVIELICNEFDQSNF
jgi:nucleoside 2-deoxyribosyltransferase